MHRYESQYDILSALCFSHHLFHMLNHSRLNFKAFEFGNRSSVIWTPKMMTVIIKNNHCTCLKFKGTV